MKIILLKDDKTLGKAGTLTEAKDGYARNFLFPRKIAVEATEENLQKWKEDRKREEEEEKQNRKEANELKKKIEKKSITIEAKGGENGKLFGAITSQNISDKIKEVFGLDIDKKRILLGEKIETEGSKTVQVKLYGDIFADLKVKVEVLR